jgi:hypothetical protein
MRILIIEDIGNRSRWKKTNRTGSFARAKIGGLGGLWQKKLFPLEGEILFVYSGFGWFIIPC